MATDTATDTTEPLRGEVITGEEPGEEPPERTRDDAAREAVDAIANLALQTPGLPGREEFLTLCMTAKILSMSPGVKRGYRGNPHLCLQAFLIGRELGIGPTTALEMIDPIPEGRDRDDEDDRRNRGRQEKGYRLSLSPKLLNARLGQLGLGRMIPLQHNAAGAVIECVGPRGEQLAPEPERFLWEHAQAAGMAGPFCWPDDSGEFILHSKDGEQPYRWNHKGSPECGCKGTYYSYPQRMMWHRCSGYAADTHYPMARLGLYSADELGALTDDEGRPLSLDAVPLPEGFEGTPDTGAPGAAGDPFARKLSADQVENLYERSAALPPAQREQLRARWDQSRLAGMKVTDLSEGDWKLANSLLVALESDARKAGVDLDAERERVRTERAAKRGASGEGDPADPPAPQPPAAETPPGDEGTGDAPPPDPETATAAEPPRSAAELLGLPEGVIAAYNGAPRDLAEHVTSHVKGMKTGEVNKALRDRNLPAGDDEPEPVRRTRLVTVMVAEDLGQAPGQLPPAGDESNDGDNPQPGGTLWVQPEGKED